MVVLSFEPLSKCKWCTFALKPLNPFVFATVFCKFKGCHVLYGFGVEKSKDSNGDVHLVFFATQMDIVWSLNHFQPCLSFLAFCSTSVHVESWSSDPFKFSSMSSSIPWNLKPVPNILSYAMWLDPFLLLYLTGVNSSTLLRLRNRCFTSRCIYIC